MIRTVADACSSLSECGVVFKRYDHPPVATCEEASLHLHGIDGVGSKNLFLRNKRGDRHFLVTVREEIRVDLRKLSEILGEGRLSFASPERLEKCLGVKPGAVTILALVNDSTGHVAAFIDRGLVDSALIQCHPMENTSTVVMSPTDILRYLSQFGREVTVIDVPATTSPI
jgi:Ala-tRNA(Pro) deacylase